MEDFIIFFQLLKKYETIKQVMRLRLKFINVYFIVVLITDNIKNGIIGGIYQMNPAFQPVFVYNIMRRTEKRLRNTPLHKEDYYG